VLKKGDVLAGIFFLIVGIGDIIGALGLPLGTPLDPKPGFFPLLAGVFLLCLSIIFLVRAFLKRNTERQAFGAVWRPGLMIGGLVIYTLILDLAGYVIATLILSLTILRILETKRWWRLVTISLAASIGSYILFDRVLGVTLPLGILKRIL